MRSKTIKIGMSLCLLSLGLWGCGEDTDPLDENCVEARLVADVCGQAVIQVLSAHADGMELGSWTHWEGQTYDQVFGTILDCEDMNSIPRDGSSFYISIIEEPREQNCAVCLALLPDMPEERYDIRVSESCNGTIE